MKCFTLLWAALAGTMRGSIAVADEFRIENGKIVVCSPFDLAVEIAYAVPRYEKRSGDCRLVRRGTVLLNMTQSPIITSNSPNEKII